MYISPNISHSNGVKGVSKWSRTVMFNIIPTDGIKYEFFFWLKMTKIGNEITKIFLIIHSFLKFLLFWFSCGKVSLPYNKYVSHFIFLNESNIHFNFESKLWEIFHNRNFVHSHFFHLGLWINKTYFLYIYRLHFECD